MCFTAVILGVDGDITRMSLHPPPALLSASARPVALSASTPLRWWAASRIKPFLAALHTNDWVDYLETWRTDAVWAIRLIFNMFIDFLENTGGVHSTVCYTSLSFCLFVSWITQT